MRWRGLAQIWALASALLLGAHVACAHEGHVVSYAANPTKPTPEIKTQKRVVIVQTTESTTGGAMRDAKPGEVEVGMLTACDVGSQSLIIAANEEQGPERKRFRLQTCVVGTDAASRKEGLRNLRNKLAQDNNLSDGLKKSVLAQVDAEIAR